MLRLGLPATAVLLLAGSSSTALDARTLLSPRAPDLATPAQEAPSRPDLLTFAAGAVPLSVTVEGPGRGVDMTHALRMVDGALGGGTFVNRAGPETAVTFLYELPAATRFERFAVPEIHETPSPSQTFVRRVEVEGAAAGPEGPFEPLAAGELAVHDGPGQETELTVEPHAPVRWVRLRLSGGLDMAREQMFLEFGEIVGQGTQEAPTPDPDRFTGTWWDRGVRLTLVQEGPTVTGCYDEGFAVSGTVTGNVFHGMGVGRNEVPSHFVLGVTTDGTVRGVRSTNGAPFALYTGAPSPDRTIECGPPTKPPVGCGSVIHGLRFAFDSAELLAWTEPVLDELARALIADPRGRIVIEGHTSSEGSEAYNLSLSDRRARSVAAALGLRGVEPERLAPMGIGEARPIATNDDESGRSMNRRVEIHCS